MKRFVQMLLIAGAVVLAPLSLTGQAHAAGVPYGETIMKLGDTGSQVSLLQDDLRVIGYFSYPNDTGYYGDLTETAVKTFQKDHGLEQNGEVGMTTGPLIQAEAAKKRGGQVSSAVSLGEQVIDTAKQYVGTPYQWGGTTPDGFDCSGFVGYVMAKHGISLPRTAADMYQAGTAVSNPRVGDLVFFSTYGDGATHVGIYVGDNHFISATSSHGVRIDSLSSSYWGPRYLGARSNY